jgi:heavy metal translocating P-type ATPase
MNSAASEHLCNHCLLPVGVRAMRRSIDGEERAFCCYGCCLAYQVRHGNYAETEATWLLVRLGVGAFLAMNVKLFSLLLYSGTFEQADQHLLPVIHVLLWALATPMLLILGWPFARDAWAEGRAGRMTSNTLLVLGVGGAYAYSVASMVTGGAHVYFDTVALLLVLFTLGRYLEANARARAVRSLAPMLAAEAHPVTVLEGGKEKELVLRDLPAGALVRVLPGERVAVDGVVVEGCSSVDESIISGEPRPVPKMPGAGVLSGSVNHEGLLLIRSTVPGAASRWIGISRAVRDALASQSPSQRLADRVAGLFVPLVLLLACLTALYWASHAPLDQALMTALAVLVVACPCALGLAAPLATTLGIARLAERGVLVRGAEVLERLAQVRVAAFDKTGTLTAGRLRLTEVVTDGTAADEVLRRAACIEQGSEHPLGRGIVTVARARGLFLPRPAAVRAIPGRGIAGECEGAAMAAGTAALLEELRYPMRGTLAARAAALEESGCTVVYVGWGGRARGALCFDDTLLPEARDAIGAIRARTLPCVLLTGDRPTVAGRIAAAVGADAWQAGLSPEDKIHALEALAQRHGPVLMVGDGLNDGPVLARAAVGVAVGSATDLARETAHMTLPPAGLKRLPWALGWARRVRRTIIENLGWAMGYNVLALALAALGYLTPVLAAVLMSGSSLLVVWRSLQLNPHACRMDAALAPPHGPPSPAVLPGASHQEV